MNEKAPFPFDDEAQLVMQSYMRDAQRKLEVLRENYVDPRNVHHFCHGTSWQSHNSYAPDRVSQLQTQSHESYVRFEDVSMGKLPIIAESLNALVNSLIEGFGSTFITTISQVCEENERVVHTVGDAGERYIAALESVEFSVGRDGNVHQPQVMVGSDTMKQLLADPSMQSPQLHARLDALNARKSAEALQRESARKAKFVKEEN